MQAFIDNFHFLRPVWLLALLPLLLLIALLWRLRQRNSDWRQLIPGELLQYLLESRSSKANHWPLLGLGAAWLLACVALAGPTWQRLPQPVQQSAAAVVVLLDMSPSLVAEDVKPSRLQRARFKLEDYLQAREEGLTGLIAYAGEAHVVSPLTDDSNTISNLLPALHPAIMPLPGSNVEMAVQRAIGLFRDAGIARGDILLVTDGVASEALPTLRRMMKEQAHRLFILGLGSAEGAPLPTGEGGFVRDGNNDIVIARLNIRDLQQLSADLDGAYTTVTADERDIRYLLDEQERLAVLAEQRNTDRQFDTWNDAGQWFVLLLLPLGALAFRRGWLLSLGFVGLVGMSLPTPSHALEWNDLWLRSDQQGRAALEAGNPASAAAEFKDPDWRGSALYRAENFEAAAEEFAQGESATDHYNRGNALAKAGELEAALEAYEQSLELQPDFDDASFNAELLRELLKQREQQQGQQQDQQQADQSQPQSGQNGEDSQQSAENQSDDSQSQSERQSAGNTSDQESSPSESQSEGQQSVNEEAARELADRQQAGEQEQQPAESDQNQQREPAQQNAAPQESEPEGEQEQTQMAAQPSPQDAGQSEQEQALQQWLRKVPDDPGGLLRRKFEYEHRRMRQDFRTGEWLPPENEAYRRW